MRSWQQWQSQIGWILKSKANDTYCLYDSGPMVQHYALNYDFHTSPNQQIREHMEAIGPNTVYRQVNFSRNYRQYDKGI